MSNLVQPRTATTEACLSSATLFDPAVHDNMISQFADIQIACIESDNMVADYIPPLQHEKVKSWWGEKAAQVTIEPPSRRIIFMAEDGKATGVVILQLNTTETGRFRGEVQKLIVSPQHRRKGIARKMMGKTEEVAKSEGRSLLVCFFLTSTLRCHQTWKRGCRGSSADAITAFGHREGQSRR